MVDAVPRAFVDQKVMQPGAADSRIVGGEAREQRRVVGPRLLKKQPVEKLRGQLAEAGPDMMWADYKHVRKVLREAGAVRDDDDAGYQWVDANKTPYNFGSPFAV